MNPNKQQIERGELMELDTFCWKCHRKDPGLFCFSCVRSFHNTLACSRSIKQEEISKWRCTECIVIQNDEQQIKKMQVNITHLNKVLDTILEHLKKDEYLVEAFMTIDYVTQAEDAVNPIDLKVIGRKIENSEYTCYEAFLSDIKWIVHNVKAYWSDDEEALKASKWLLELVKEEIYSIRMCDECCVNLTRNHFEMLCKQPHLVVWAKQKTYPYWPAKLMSVNVERNTVDVRYFGEKHYRAVLSPKDCLMYSQLSPSVCIGAYRQSLSEAQKEANSYIENLTKKYGSFNYATSNTLLHADKLERHLFDMIPNAWKQLGKDVVPPSIPKPVPCSATLNLRQSVPARRLSISTITNSVNTNRIMTRRMSMLLIQPHSRISMKVQTKKKFVDVNR